MPKWEGHVQPLKPLWGYENEADPQVVEKKFEQVLRRAKAWSDANPQPGMPKLITVNSWNEWTEGSCLEPDTINGFGYLEAVRRVVE